MTSSPQLLQHFLAALAYRTQKALPPENFVLARVRTDDVGADQPEPASPDPGWAPNLPPGPDGPPGGRDGS